MKTSGISLMLVLVFPVSAALGFSASQPGPLQVEDAMQVLNFAVRTPIDLSPDGQWVAYTLENPSRRESTQDERYLFYTPTGAFQEAAGCDVWITNAQSGKSQNLTQGVGTSWAPVWSPDGKYLAFYSDRNGTAHLWLWERATGQLRQLSEVIVRPFFNFQVVRWTSDSRQILAKVLPENMTLEQATELTERPRKEVKKRSSSTTSTVVIQSSLPADKQPRDSAQPTEPEHPTWMNRYMGDLVLIDVATAAVKRLAREVKPLGYWISPSGTYLAYTNWKSVEPNSQQPLYDLVLVSLRDDRTQVLVSNLKQEYGISVSWSPDGKLLAYTTAGPKTQGDCVIVSTEGDEPRNVTETPHPTFADDHRAPLWDSAGQSLYFIGSGSYGRLHSNTLWKVSLTDYRLTELAKVPDRQIVEIVSPTRGGRFWSPDGGRSMVVSMHDETTKKVGFYSIDLTTGKASRLFEEDSDYGELIFNMDQSDDGKTVVYVAQDARHAEDIWVAGVDFRNRRRLTRINPQLENYVFGSSRVIEWRSIDGQLLHGALLLPANYEEGKRCALIVNVYGGSFRSKRVNQFGLSGAGVENMQLLGTRGYAILLPDAPLQKGSPMQDLLKTVMPGVDKAIEMGIADSDRLGVMGHSYGGYSTLALIVQTTRFKAAMASAGIGNLISNYGDMIGWSEEGQGGVGGTLWQFRDRYIETSPLFFLDRVQTPLLIVHGALDAMAAAQAQEVFAGLRRLGKEVVYAKYLGEEHHQGTWRYANVLDYWNRVITWFDGHLKTQTQAGPRGKF